MVKGAQNSKGETLRVIWTLIGLGGGPSIIKKPILRSRNQLTGIKYMYYDWGLGSNQSQ